MPAVLRTADSERAAFPVFPGEGLAPRFSDTHGRYSWEQTFVTGHPTRDQEDSDMAAKKPANHGKPWTPQDVKELRQLAKENTPTRLIAWKMKRTEDSVRSQASDISLSLKPTNKSPYNRQKK